MKLLIADDHTLFRDTLLEYIERAEPDTQVLVANDLQSALTYLEAGERPNLILLDYHMPGMRGLEGLRDLKTAYPDLAVTLMSGVAEPEDIEEAIKIGIVGYFPKTMSGKAFVKAIQLVLTGEKFFSYDADAQQMMPSYYADPDNKPFDKQTGSKSAEEIAEGQKKLEKLSTREKEVLAHLMKGQSNKEIANILELQEVTIKLHVRGVCRKLGAKNRTQAALMAQELNFQDTAE